MALEGIQGNTLGAYQYRPITYTYVVVLKCIIHITIIHHHVRI